MIMWSDGQWEASKKIAWGGDRQTDRQIYRQIYKLTSQLLERNGLRADSLKITISNFNKYHINRFYCSQ